MTKLSSYQKLKKRVELLEQQIHTLVTEPDSDDARAIKIARQMQYDMTEVIWFGSANPDNDTYNGIISQIYA